MLPPDWKELQPLVDQILDAPEEDRAELIDKFSAGDPERKSSLEKFVAECSSESDFLARPAGEQFAGLFADDPEPPPPTMLGGYRIEREIGRGGMARVYLGDDAKHSRRVAVKVIRSELAASLGRERFLREISTAARLRHPNIVPLYDSGDENGMLFFVMPYEEGPSLRDRLKTGVALTVEERLSTLRDIARALAYAHDQGVVHRDIKPDNVMLSGGAAVVTDFGISKAVSSAQGADALGTLTQSGSGIGTPAYMAPEQAVGDPSTDHRADIYSFGCLAYELFAGTPPFHGMAAHQIITAHIGNVPPPIETAAPDIPPGVARLVMRCLEKNPDARPQNSHELLTELERGASIPGAAPARRFHIRVVQGVLALLALFVVAGVIWMNAGTSSATATVAVLPLVSVGRDSLQQELADGLSDEIATALFKVPGIRVVSRRGVVNYRGQRDVDPGKIGKELGAQFLVMGSLREVDGRLVVFSQLLDARNGSLLWSDRFDRVQAELGPIRDEIAGSIGDTLHRILGIAKNSSVAQRPTRTKNPDAYRLYVLAQNALSRRGLSIKASAEMFRSATKLDTTYAQAYSGLSMAIALTPYFAPIPAKDVAEEATSVALHALRLDPTLAQPHIALGVVYQNSFQWERAAREFRTAISLDSRDVEARVQYGRHLIFRDHADAALVQFLAARNEDPASALVSSWVSYCYYVRGQIDSAMVESARAYQSDSTNLTTLSFGSLVRLKSGRTREALDLARQALPNNEAVLYVLAATGDSATAMTRIRNFENNTPSRWRAETMRTFTLLGAKDTARALTALERATDANEIWPTLESSRDPVFDPIRNSPRFQRLLRRVGLL